MPGRRGGHSTRWHFPVEKWKVWMNSGSRLGDGRCRNAPGAEPSWARALHHSPAAHRYWGSRKCHSCDPQSLIYEPRLPPSKRLSFLLTKAAAREGSVWVPPIPPAQLSRNIPPQQGPACSSLLPGSPSSTSGSMLHPRRVVRPQGLGRVAPAGIPTDPSHLPASGTLPVQLTTPHLIPSEDET